MPTPTTAGRGYQLPHPDNRLDADVLRIVAAFNAIDVDIVAFLTQAQTLAGVKTFSSSPVIPNVTAGDNSTKAANTAFVQSAIAALVAASPAALDTLNELSAALGNDANFATTITNALGLKAPLASPTFTGTPAVPTATAGTSTTQAASTAFVAAALAAFTTVPTGSTTQFAGSAAPSGWLLCYGQAVSRTTYSALFAVISTAFGVGDGSTTFNLPDLRGRVPAGKDDMGGTAANTLNVTLTGTRASTSTSVITGLSSTAALVVGMKAAGTGVATNAVITSIDSSTQVTLSINNTSTGSGSIRFGIVDGATLGDVGGSQAITLTTGQMPAHTHSDGIAGAGGNVGAGGAGYGYPASGTTGSTGGGQAHGNMQPTIVMNYIIKT